MKFYNWLNNIWYSIRNFFKNLFGNDQIEVHQIKNNKDVSVVNTEITDNNKAFEISVPVPGLNKDDISVSIENGFLKIASEKKSEREEKNENWVYKEFNYGSFKEMIKLPENADSNVINAHLENGLLNIQIGKKKTKERIKKTIAIT